MPEHDVSEQRNIVRFRGRGVFMALPGLILITTGVAELLDQPSLFTWWILAGGTVLTGYAAVTATALLRRRRSQRSADR